MGQKVDKFFHHWGTLPGQITATSIVPRRSRGSLTVKVWRSYRGNGGTRATFSACKIRNSMASKWQSKLARVSRMDWEEVRVRVGQEFHKHSDLLMHRMGVHAAIRLNTDSAGQPGQFFFSAGAISERTELLRKHLPDEAAEILHEADEICGHRFRLLGYEHLEFTVDRGSGNFGGTNFGDNSGGTPFKDIDWHLDPVHGKRAPLNPWFKIR